MIEKTPGLEERQAINRLKQGDLNGLEMLVRHYQERAIYAAYLIVRDVALAEDIVQSAFLNAAQKIDQFDERKPFGGWFFRSVVNNAIKCVQKQQRYTPLDENEESDGSIIHWILDPDLGPEHVVETEETRQMVWRALERLSAEQRAVIVMRHFLEMNEEDMMRQFDRPSSTIRWWLRTARNRLRDLLQPLRDEDAPAEQD